MHDDAADRLEALMATKKKKTQAERIRELLPRIEGSRAAGATWGEIAEAIGVPKPSLLAALAPLRAPKTAPSPPSPPRPEARAKGAADTGVTRWPTPARDS